MAIALIAGLPGILAAFAALLVRRQIQTPSGTPIGKQTESMHHVALGNNYRLQRLTGELAEKPTPEAVEEEEQINPPNGDKHKNLSAQDG